MDLIGGYGTASDDDVSSISTILFHQRLLFHRLHQRLYQQLHHRFLYAPRPPTPPPVILVPSNNIGNNIGIRVGIGMGIDMDNGNIAINNNIISNGNGDIINSGNSGNSGIGYPTATTILHGKNHPEFDRLAQKYYDEWKLLGNSCCGRERFYKNFINKVNKGGWKFLDKNGNTIDITDGYNVIKQRIKTRFGSIQRKNKKSRVATS
jgi:hypothetical protein